MANKRAWIPLHNHHHHHLDDDIADNFHHDNKSKYVNGFSCLDWNILSYKYASQHAGHCPDQYLKTEYRIQLILDELDRCDADIICLQEVDEDPVFHGHIEPWAMTNGYAIGGFLVCPSDSQGVVLLYKPSTFVCLESSIIRYADIDDTALLHGYEEGAVLLMLKMRANAMPLCIAGTHLYWNPALPQVKTRQAEILKQACSRFSPESHTIPTIIMGDLNDLPETQSCGVHAALQSDMTSAMSACLGGTEPHATTSTPWFTGCLDYIYYTHTSLGCSAYWGSDAHAVSIPDQYNPSDHIPIAVRFLFL